MKLYYVPRTRSTRPRWALEELGVHHELVRLDPGKGDTRSDEHTTRHPLQHVPVLETREGSIFESAAIVLHLADKYESKGLIPPPGAHDRGLTYQWLFFAMTELEPPCIRLMAQLRAKTPDSPEAVQARADIIKAVRPLDRVLSTREYLVGDAFSVADIIVGEVLYWAKRMMPFEHLPHAAKYVERLEARPAFKKAHAD